MKYRVNLGDLYYDLADNKSLFSEDTPIGTVEDICNDAARIICLLDDWMTAKMRHRQARMESADWSTMYQRYEAVLEAEKALFSAIVTDYMAK